MVLNVLGYTGIGTIVAGEYRTGVLQLTAALLGVLLAIMVVVRSWSPWLLLATLACVLATYAWAAATSIRMVAKIGRD